MAKRNNQIDTDVIALSATGLSQRAIAKKLSISQATVSKILNNEKNNQKLSNGIKVINDYNEETKRNNRKKAHEAIDGIIEGLKEDLKKASLKDKRETLKTLVELFGLPEEEETQEVTEIKIEIEDASGATDYQDGEAV